MTGLRPDIVVKTPVAISRRCKFCHDIHDSRFCPRVKALSYHTDGTLARVEFWPTPEFINPKVSSIAEVNAPVPMWQADATLTLK